VQGSPATADDVVSVASSLSGGDTTAVDVNGTTYESVEGAGPVRIADGTVVGDLAQPSDSGNVLGCSPIADDMSNKVALISRGVCAFDDKYINAQDAGAVAIVVYNDGTAPDRVAPITMGGIGSSGTPITIPGTMISSFDGAALSAAIGGGPLVATLDQALTVPTSFGDTISTFSSLGPGLGGSTFKPDLTAPGDAILSTNVGSGTGGTIKGGTSMATPHVAGLSALLIAANPDLEPAAIKAMMQNSTVDAVADGLIGPPVTLSRQGTGVVRANKAVQLTSYATPGGVSFGRINPSKKIKRKVSADLVNLSTDSRTYSVTHVPNHTFPGVEVSCPDYVSVRAARDKPGKGKGRDKHHGDDNKHKGHRYKGKWAKHDASRRFDIELTMDPAAGPWDDAFESQTEVDGWCVLDDGQNQIRVGYLAVVDPASDMRARFDKDVLKVSNKRGNVGWAEGFSLASEDGLLLDDTFNAFKAIGFRSNSYAAFGDLIEFGIASEAPWESFATGEIDIFVDVDGDGADDALLVVADFFGDGLPVTAIFPQGEALFYAGVDYNDNTAILTFFSKTDAPLGFLGFLPAGDTDFDYTAVFFDARTGEYDAQVGSVDLANEVIPAASTFGLAPDDSVELPVAGDGDMLWLFQNNPADKGHKGSQAQIVRERSRGHKHH